MRAWRHLLSLLLPAIPVVFVATAPHPWWVALAMLPALLLVVGVDLLSGPARRAPAPDDARPEEGREWPFDLLLVVHAAIHFALLAGYLRLVHREGIASADFLGRRSPRRA